MSVLATANLSATAQRDLVIAVQSDSTGAAGALEDLTAAFLPAIQAASHASDAIHPDDAFQVAAEAFVLAVRNYDTDSELPFAATVSPILHRAVLREARVDNLISIPDAALARYWRLMHKHGMDAEAAYAAAQNINGDGISKAGFLAVHNVISGVADVADNDEVYDSPDQAIIRADYVAWLFTKVTDPQESILRLRYGFDDTATANLIAAWNDNDDNVLYAVGDVLDDLQVSDVTGIPRSTVNRQARNAIAAMRAADAEVLAAEEAASA